MTVKRSAWIREDLVNRISQQRNEGNAYPAKGLQVAATLVALRIGYKLAKTAVGRLFPEKRVPSIDEEGQSEDAFAETTCAADGSPTVAAHDQWVVTSQPAPSVPDGFKLVASEHLPISVYHFYEQFLSIEATCLQDHHQSTGQYNFRASRWKPDTDGCFSRQFDFIQPKKGIASANAHCIQEQRFSVHPGGVFVMMTDMHMEGIPYQDCFKVQSCWKAEPDATGMGTNVSIHVAVPFSKGCLVKGLIIKTTMGDCKTFFSDFLSKVQNSISKELLPSAAAAAAATEQLLGGSPGGGGSALSSPFATADGQVYISSSRGTNSSSDASAARKTQRQQQQLHRKGSAASSPANWPQQQQRMAAVMEAERLLTRTVSSKPSFAQSMSELGLVSRSQRHEVISMSQAILLLLILIVQLLTLYDNMLLHGKLAAAAGSCL